MTTYCLADGEQILIQSGNIENIERVARKRIAEMESNSEDDTGFTVFEKTKGRVFHVYHTWLSSSDGECHSRGFHPKKDVTDSFNERYASKQEDQTK